MNAAQRLLAAATLAWLAAPALAQPSGEDLYRTYCAQCHGLQGNGKGINVRDMSVQPRDHTDSKYMAGRTDEELRTAIVEGGQALSKSVLMPPWGSVLEPQEVDALVAYLRKLCDCQHGRP